MSIDSKPASKTKTKTKQTTKPKVQHGRRYRVILHNDDVTPMDFVVDVLRSRFHKSLLEASRIMLEAHVKGLAYVATLALEQAEFRVDQSHSMARTRKYPLTMSIEPEP